MSRLPPIAGYAPQYLGLTLREACYREHPGGVTRPEVTVPVNRSKSGQLP